MHPKPFTSVVWATDIWESVDQNQRDLAKGFFELLKSQTGLSSSEISFVQKWAEDPPKEALGQSLDDYMVKAIRDLAYQPGKNMQQFRQDYYKEIWNTALPESSCPAEL
ncbi:hypothetical protein CLAIMM_07655 [Cladophialophora immunda]|nr:hypothetical protein CLAIMM_07655 [Cladophialophora immunda]